MKILTHRQGSAEWLAARIGVPTASELKSVLTDSLTLRKGETPLTYAATKAAERWLGRAIRTFGGGAMEQGTLLEPEARPLLALRLDCTIREVGFVTSDSGEYGCSPDGMLPDGSGVEIKSPMAHTHARWLIDGGLPDEHRLQCLGGMVVTGADRWTFMSYCRGFPPLIVPVTMSDDERQAVLSGFIAAKGLIDAAYAKILAANDGQPPVIEDGQEYF